MPMRAYGAQFGVKGYYPLCEPWHLSCPGDKTPAKPHVTPTPLRAHGAQ